LFNTNYSKLVSYFFSITFISICFNNISHFKFHGAFKKHCSCVAACAPALGTDLTDTMDTPTKMTDSMDTPTKMTDNKDMPISPKVTSLLSNECSDEDDEPEEVSNKLCNRYDTYTQHYTVSSIFLG